METFECTHTLVIPISLGWNRSDAMEVFRQIDKDKNGVLSLVEFQDWWEVRDDLVTFGSRRTIIVV